MTRFPLELGSSNKQAEADPTALTMVPIQDGSFVWTVSNFLSETECQEWVQFAEESGGLEYTAHPASSYTTHRKCFRMQDESNRELAQKLYLRLLDSGVVKQLKQALAPSAPSTRTKRRKKCSNVKYENPVGFNPNLRLYKYIKGHSFGRHIDESNVVEGMGQTEITVLIYLSRCEGGATRFYKDKASFKFHPEPGTMLLHVHGYDCLEHEAEPVLAGTNMF
eukprot:scaffold1807_cov140-Cylindrotheca_fusiformis.AAC.10